MKRLTNNAAKTILMVRPAHFGFNFDTASDNVFQNKVDTDSTNEVHTAALAEFDAFVAKLKAHQVDVVVMEDTPEPKKPDAIFPNNWFSTHADGRYILYPVLAKSRQFERRRGFFKLLSDVFEVNDEIDLSHYEADEKYLESTGSMVFDHLNGICFACLSQRTDSELVRKVCEIMKYQPLLFHASDEDGNSIYHTNVMLSVGNKIAIICAESITNAAERQQVENALRLSGREIVRVSYEQMRGFCCNALEVQAADGQQYYTMSTQAYNSFTLKQRERIEKYQPIIHSDVSTVEQVGGGGSRCMMAEIFLPEKQPTGTKQAGAGVETV